MLTILVTNSKGGCGKTTLATGLAGALAQTGLATALADCDRQKSSLDWVERRPACVPPVAGLDWSRDIGTTPRHLQRLVVDAPAALRRSQVEVLVKAADVVVVPVLPGVFDEGATSRFLARLDTLKPIRKHRRAVAVVGNRMRARTKAAERLEGFLDGLGHRVVTRLRDSQLYPGAALDGLSLFDLESARARDHAADWDPLLHFVDEAAAERSR